MKRFIFIFLVLGFVVFLSQGVDAGEARFSHLNTCYCNCLNPDGSIDSACTDSCSIDSYNTVGGLKALDSTTGNYYCAELTEVTEETPFKTEDDFIVRPSVPDDVSLYRACWTGAEQRTACYTDPFFGDYCYPEVYLVGEGRYTTDGICLTAGNPYSFFETLDDGTGYVYEAYGNFGHEGFDCWEDVADVINGEGHQGYVQDGICNDCRFVDPTQGGLDLQVCTSPAQGLCAWKPSYPNAPYEGYTWPVCVPEGSDNWITGWSRYVFSSLEPFIPPDSANGVRGEATFLDCIDMKKPLIVVDQYVRNERDVYVLDENSKIVYADPANTGNDNWILDPVVCSQIYSDIDTI